VRGGLARYPLFYSFFGGVGVILFWRGVWHSADWLEKNTYWGGVIFSNLGSMVFGVSLLLITGLFVSIIIGDSIIISGIRNEKKISEKTEEEIVSEKEELTHMHQDLEDIKDKLN
jgi:hypothetical protein